MHMFVYTHVVYSLCRNMRKSEVRMPSPVCFSSSLSKTESLTEPRVCCFGHTGYLEVPENLLYFYPALWLQDFICVLGIRTQVPMLIQ